MDELQNKLIKIAAQICWEYGSIAGDRICQDWDLDTALLDSLTEDERNHIMREYEEYNSGGEDFTPGYFPYDAMLVSFAVARALENLVAD